jgi:hypothetical protein
MLSRPLRNYDRTLNLAQYAELKIKLDLSKCIEYGSSLVFGYLGLKSPVLTEGFVLSLNSSM